jgi:large subunit ribosomal protein L21
MYAVVTSGGKQYKVKEGETLKVEKIPGDVGSSIKFDRVLMISDGNAVSIGQPVLDDAMVEGHIVEQGKSKKIIVFKYKRRKRYRRKHGHRQLYTAIKIDSIKAKAVKAGKKAGPEIEAKKPDDKKVEAKETAAGVEAKKPEAPKAAVKETVAKKPEAKAEAKKTAAKKPAAKTEATEKETEKTDKPKAKKAEAKPKAKKADTKKAAAKKTTAKKPAAKKTTTKSKKKTD